jgi:hypothetical protein
MHCKRYSPMGANARPWRRYACSHERENMRVREEEGYGCDLREPEQR